MATLAVALKTDRSRIDFPLRLDEFVALRALQLLAASFSVEYAAGLEVERVVEEKGVGIAPRREVGMLAAEGEDAEVLLRLRRQRGRILDVCGDVAMAVDTGGVCGRRKSGEAAMESTAIAT